MKSYRRKPEIVQARQFGESVDVQTKQGITHLPTGDWLIRKANEEYETMKDEAFREQYEPVEEKEHHNGRSSETWGQTR